MPRYAIGQPIRLSTVVTDIDGVTADPTDISLTMQCFADDTTTTYNYLPGDIVRDSAGHFHVDLTTLTVAGHYAYAWTTTGSNAGVGPSFGSFEVFDSLSVGVVSTEDARTYLRMVEGVNVSADDARLADIIGSVTAGLIQLVGHIVPTTVTETVYGWGSVQLGHGPVSAVTAISAADGVAGAVRITDVVILPGDVVSTVAGAASFGGWYTVTYTAGPTTIPDEVRGAALDWILHRWRQSQSHASATYGELLTDFRGPPNAVVNQIRHLMVSRSGV
jgi:hypothetical protein